MNNEEREECRIIKQGLIEPAKPDRKSAAQAKLKRKPSTLTKAHTPHPTCPSDLLVALSLFAHLTLLKLVQPTISNGHTAHKIIAPTNESKLENKPIVTYCPQGI
jgi:hypothetical protein